MTAAPKHCAQAQRVRAYQPIRDYALIGDCHGAALVARDGSVDWCCLGRFDATPVLWRLLDAEKGAGFEIRPARESGVERTYIPDTNIVRMIFATPKRAKPPRRFRADQRLSSIVSWASRSMSSTAASV